MIKKEIMDIVQSRGIEFVHLQFVDIAGILKAVTVPSDKLSDAIEDGVWFDGSSIDGFARIFESDMFLKPDLSTFNITPWEDNENDILSARMFCDILTPDRKRYEGDPRGILKNVLEEAREMGFEYNVGPELEFFLFKKQYDKHDNEIYTETVPVDKTGYFDVSMDRAGELRKEISLAIKEMGVDVETIHKEVATGQHEISFKYADALTTAENMLKTKLATKTISEFYDFHATFMPKPISGINGSGMHVHQSLWDIEKKRNAFFSKDGEFHLSDLAQSFIAGQLKQMKKISAILSPTVNSYKRLVPGYEAPVYISWGQNNRSALMRIPRYTVGRENAVRAELRSPDPTANPYLTFAIMLAAGLDGIKKGLKPPKSIAENIYDLDEKKAKRLRISILPKSLEDAIENLEKSELVKKTLGDHTFKKFIEMKKIECEEYKMTVSKWELERYLPIF